MSVATRVRLLVSGAILTCAFVLLGSAGAGADPLFSESFTQPMTSDSGFSVGQSVPAANAFKGVCLTASANTAQTPVPGCPAGQKGIPAGGDAAGSGALRFTDNNNNEAGFLLSNTQLPLTAGLDVTFDYYSYGGTGADGLSFFLADGATTLTAPGATGGSLGYAQDQNGPGVANGYLGVGLDEYGNFTNNSQSKGAGCTSDAAFNGTARHPSWVGIRGPGNGRTGYCLLAKAAAPAPLSQPAAPTRTTAGVRQRVEVTVDPPVNANPMVTVTINGVRVLATPEPPNPPSTFKFGFTASTGGATNIHEIQNVQINTINTLPRLSLTSTPSATPVAGTSFTSTLQGTVAAGAGSESQPVTITQTLPTGETVGALPSGSGWDCSATVVGSSSVSCTYTPSGPLAPGTALPALSVPTDVAPDARGPLTSTATIASTDNASTPAQSTATATVTPTAAADTSVAVTPPSSAELGEPATFTVTAANAGPSTATDATVTVPVPPGTTFDSGPAGCTQTGDTVTCAVGTLAPGASAVLPLVFTSHVAGSVALTATVGQAEPDGDVANNTATASVQVPAPAPPPLPAPPPTAPTARTADLAASVSATTPSPSAGQPTGFALTVTNHGPDADPGVVVSAPVPSGARVTALSPGCRVVSQTILCVAGTLDRGHSARFDVVVEPASSGPLALTATVIGALPDVHPDDNVASAQTTVTGASSVAGVDLAVSESAPASVPRGRPATLTTTVTNRGEATATGVVVAVPLPPGAVPVATPKGCARHGTVVICTIKALRAHHKATFKLRVAFNGHGRQGTTATVRGAQPDPRSSDNHARVTLHVTTPKPTRAPRPRLSLTDRFAQRSVLGGHRATLRLTVRTSNRTTARHVAVCDTLAPGLTVVSAPGATVRGRRVCFSLSRVTGRPRRLTVRVRAAPVSHTTVLRDRATARGGSAARVRASGRLVVVAPPAPKFTG